MKQLFLLATLLLFCQNLVQAQDKVSINGNVVDSDLKQPIEAATVYLSSAKDSTVINYSITDESGKFNLSVSPTNEPVFFSVSDELNGDYRIDFENLLEDKNLDEIILSPIISLGEAVIKGGAPPIRIKSDTLEFNASSFKVRPDANVESLLRELPGVEIDDEGKITVNGKEVNQILVNGKPFFDKNGKIAIENLPADIINKVQVTDTKTKKEEISGDKASSENASINLTIDEDKNKGFMLKALAGYGTDERYESSLMANYFNGDRKISVLGSSNNINSVGFSMNDIFDNMSGGRSTYTRTYGNGSFNINGIRFGGGNGITQSNLGGLNYVDKFGKSTDFNSSYFYTSTDTDNSRRRVQQNLLPNNIYTSNNNEVTRNQSDNHNFKIGFDIEIDSTANISYMPSFTKNKVRSSKTFNNFTIDENDDLLNESEGLSNNINNSQTIGNELYFYKAFKNKSKLSVDVITENGFNDNETLTNSSTVFYQSNDEGDDRNQITNSRNTNDKYEFLLDYKYPVLDSLSIGVGIGYEVNKKTYDKLTFDFDEPSQTYTQTNNFLTLYNSSNAKKVNPFVVFNSRKNKYYFNLILGTQILSQENTGEYLGDVYNLKQEEVLPSINFNGRYKISKSKSIYTNYNYEVNFASALQVLSIENLSNPLATYIGNPNLKPRKTHNFYLNFNNYDFESRSGFYTYAGGNFQETDIVNYTSLDNSFKSNTTYVNVYGNYNFYAGFNKNKTIKKDKNTYRFGGGVYNNFTYNQGFVNQQKYTASNFSVSPNVYFSWDYDKVITIKPSYRLNWTQSNYNNYIIDKSSNIIHTFKLSTTNYWPKNVVFGNDFSYTYNSNISAGFKKDFYLWNTSLGYNFFKDQFTFKVKVYDVLNQNQSNTRRITDTAIIDEENTILRRYVMFSLGFKLDKFAGKKKDRKIHIYN